MSAQLRQGLADQDPPTRDRILVAAAGLFRTDPNASMEAIASAANLSRATVHRHFPAREALVAELRRRALAQIHQIFTAALTSDLPIVVRLFNVTADLLAAKLDWSWALREIENGDHPEDNPVLDGAVEWMRLLARHGYVDASADFRWPAVVYLTIIRAATSPLGPDDDGAEYRAARAVDTFLHGVGTTSIRYQAGDV
ncbi:TetR/AcrR family transcriptional regulator [Mycolicibacterium boenickei]